MGGGKVSDRLPSGTSPPQNSLSMNYLSERGQGFVPEYAIEAEKETSTSLDSSSSDSAVEEVDEEQEAARRWRSKTFHEVMEFYETSGALSQALSASKDAIRRLKPGDWVKEVGTTKPDDYQVPETMTLLLVGPRGSGKSSLVNRITRIFDDDALSPARAQVLYNWRTTLGSCFLLEYMVPRNSTSLCIYDTRSLSPVHSDNFKLLKLWMTKGVRHGDMITRDSDTSDTKKRIKAMARQGLFTPCQKRMVNFVIFVVDGVSVLNSMNSKDAQYTDLVVETFNYPFLSFKDTKPAVVVTHGDELSLTDRARVCTHLGELLGIPPTQQVFDIPEASDYATELAIVRMLRYSIEHASRNLPFKQQYLQEGQKILLRMMDRSQLFDAWTRILEVLIISLCIIVLLVRDS